jgi:tetratricopeptide (TPR) repeat protein
MARASTRGRKGTRPSTRQRARTYDHAEDLIFFPRLRRRAKWVFLALAVAFALGFVGFGVGAGGSGIGDYLSDLFNRQPSASGASAENARDRIKQNPKDAKAHLELANALQAEGKTEEAIQALEDYVKLRPKDEDALQQLAGLNLITAGEAEERLRVVAFESQRAGFGEEIETPNGVLAKGLDPAPVADALRGDANERYRETLAATQAAYRREADVWRTLTALNPDEPSYFLELGRSSAQSGDTSQGILAYNRYLELSPDAANAAEIKNLVRQLELQTQLDLESGGAAGGG